MGKTPRRLRGDVQGVTHEANGRKKSKRSIPTAVLVFSWRVGEMEKKNLATNNGRKI